MVDSYTHPTTAFLGADTFAFVATDGSGNSTIATAVVDVVSIAPPTTQLQTIVNNEDEEFIVEGLLLPTPDKADDRETADATAKRQVRFQDQKAYTTSQDNLDSAQSNNQFSNGAAQGFFALQTIASGESTSSNSDFTAADMPFSQQLFSSLASFDQEIDDATESLNYSFVNSIVSFSGFSLVAATWILRSGALLASMMANLPAWRIIDPLVVLGYSNDGDNGGETLHDIIENGQANENEEPTQQVAH